MDRTDPNDWSRAPRSSVTLPRLTGVYALYLSRPAALPEVTVGSSGLLYIGRACNRRGLEGRCHFKGRTVNHSPRKSLAALLRHRLTLRSVLVLKQRGDTWGLEPESDAKLSAWMHKHLLLAIQPCDDAVALEASLIRRHAPPLNLGGCELTVQHRRLAEARSSILAELRLQPQRFC